MNWKKLVLSGLSISALFACVQEARIPPDITATLETVGAQWQTFTFYKYPATLFQIR